MRFGAVVAASVAVLVAGTSLGLAQDGLALIKARKDFMAKQQDDVNKINKYAKGQGDKQAALDGANDLVALNPKIMDQFAKGTSATEFPGKTLAKPELWQEMDKATAITASLKDAEVKLVSVVNTGTPEDVGKEMSTVYRTQCNACHTPYRLPEKH